jgi:HEAT repeat protein
MSARLYPVLLLAVLACVGCGAREKSTTELLTDLKGGAERDRTIAVRSLSNDQGDAARVVPALSEALKDRESDVRLSSAIKLGMFGEDAREAVPALQSALGDRDARVREAAGKALARIDPAKYPTPPKGTAPKRR